MRWSFARLCKPALLLIALLTGINTGVAHEGHDHGAPPPPTTNTIAPRADASSADFEIVLIARGGELQIHLDAFRTNAPIPGATIEIDTPSGQLLATAKGDGVYLARAPFLETPDSARRFIRVGQVLIRTSHLRYSHAP